MRALAKDGAALETRAAANGMRRRVSRMVNVKPEKAGTQILPISVARVHPQ
jgi:hypothetical protein